MTARPEGVGCRRYVTTAAALLAFGALAFVTGLVLLLDRGCTGPCEKAALALYAAGGPVSGLFAVLAGGLPVAWPVDITLWLAVAFLATSLAERRGRPWWQGVLAAMTVAGAFGTAAAFLLERA